MKNQTLNEKELIADLGLEGAANVISDRITRDIDNTYVASRLYASHIRTIAIPAYQLYTEYKHMMDKSVQSFIISNFDTLEAMIDRERDNIYTYSGIRDIVVNYLFKIKGEPREEIQWMWMRVAVQVAYPDLNDIKATYDMLSTKLGIHATPTCVNAGMCNNQLESCFCIDIGDNMNSIANAQKLVLMGSKCNGGFGIYVGRIRHSRVYNRGITKGVPGLLYHLFNNSVAYADQLGSRPGACTAYCPVWHKDIETFIIMRNKVTAGPLWIEHINLAVCIPDLFYIRAQQNKQWSLFCPRETQLLWASKHGVDISDSSAVDKCPSLCDMHGKDFEQFYLMCEDAGIASATVSASDLEHQIQIQTCQSGMPFIFNIDNVNRKSNQQHLGTIVHSNLCVHPDTLILTSKGDIPIIDLVGKVTTVWNGLTWSSVTPRKTGESQLLWEIFFSNGRRIVCTPYHKFHILGNSPVSSVIEARSLSIGDQLIPWLDPNTNRLVDPISVTSIVKDVCVSDTYCFNEPINHTGIFNGIIAGNCTEIVQFSKPDEIYPTCDLATINIAQMLDVSGTAIDWKKLAAITRLLVRNLNRVIDRTSGILDNTGYKLCQQYLKSEDPVEREVASRLISYMEKDPTANARNSNRAVGIGIMGFTSMLSQLNICYGSNASIDLLCNIRAAIYWHSLDESHRLAQISGPYVTFEGSSISKGILTPDQWIDENQYFASLGHNRYNFKLISPSRFGVSETWDDLRTRVKSGIRNSFLTCQMPNVTTANIFAVSAGIEPYYEILKSRNGASGSTVVIYESFISVMKKYDLYDSQKITSYLMENYGKVQGLHTIFDIDDPRREKCKKLESLFESSFSINKKTYILLNQISGMYVDQAQSLNIFFDKPNSEYMVTLNRYAWMNGCKTRYYCRRMMESLSRKTLCTKDDPECRSCQ